MLKAAAVTNVSIDGIKGPPCMLLFDNFNVVNYFAIDFMHGVGLGVTKQIIEIWLGIRKIPEPENAIKYKFRNVAERKIFNERIIKFKPLMHFRRKPRPIFEVANYKASELINFLFYYSRFATLNLLPNRINKNIELLSAAIFILCKPSMTFLEIDKACAMLTEFSDGFEEIYGKGAITMNIHLLRHYADMIKISGPLWANSLFAFESNIGEIKKYVTGNTDVLVQISQKYAISKTFDIEEDEKLVQPNEKLFQEKKIPKIERCISILKSYDIDLTQQKYLTIYRRLNLNGHTYTSEVAKETKSVDYFVELQDGSLGTVQFYIKINDVCFLFLNKYEIVYVHNHISEVKQTETSNFFLCKNIKRKLLFLKCSGIEYIVTEPQKYYFIS